MYPKVAICIVTHNSADDLPHCLNAVARLEYRPVEIVIVDCASTDDSLAQAEQLAPGGLPTRIVALDRNLGYAGGMNAAIEQTDAPLILSLNPDARPEPDYVNALADVIDRHRDLKIGAVAGRLLRPRSEGERLIDATGMRLTPTWRHLDLESGQPDRNQRSVTERVFGATGAASLFVREALEDVAVDGDVFLPEFHSYREDAELCFRLRERRWEVLYEPRATAVHARRNVPERRRQMPLAVNYHSLKNRYLLRFYHQTWSNFLRTAGPTLLRDVAILAYVLVRERSSLVAYRWLWSHRSRIRSRRQKIRRRRLASSSEIDAWFFKTGEPV